MSPPGTPGIVEYAPERGRLRLTAEAFDVLVARAGGGASAEDSEAPAPADPAVVAALEAAGAVVGDALDPTVEALVAPAVSSLCVLEVSLAGVRGVTGHRAFLAPDGATALLHVSGGMFQVVHVPPGAVPALAARTVGFGPRPRLAAAATTVPGEVVAGLSAPDRSAVLTAADRLADAAAAAGWSAWADALRAGTWRLWTARATWPGPDGELGGRAVTALDTPAGTVRVLGLDEGDREEPELVATTPTDLWLELVRLLPSDEELGRA